MNKKSYLHSETEVWKEIEGFENLYMVSNFGNVLSLRIPEPKWNLPRVRTYVRKFKNDIGDEMCKIYKDGKRFLYRIETLVEHTFKEIDC